MLKEDLTIKRDQRVSSTISSRDNEQFLRVSGIRIDDSRRANVFLSMLRYVCSFTVKVISHPDNSTSFEVIESQLENPLIDADHHDLVAMKQIPVPGGHHHKTQHKRNQTDDRNREYIFFTFCSIKDSFYIIYIYLIFHGLEK